MRTYDFSDIYELSDIQLFYSAIKKIGKIVNVVYIYIESSMNGFIKFEVKELKKKEKIVNVHFRNCCANKVKY